MGQYFYVVNTDKKQYLMPHCLGDGLKLMEFGASGDGTMLGLALLLRQSNEGGGGDFHGDHDSPLLGSWAGNRIVIVGDYDKSGLYQEATDGYENISHAVVELMEQDPHTKANRAESAESAFVCEHPRETPA